MGEEGEKKLPTPRKKLPTPRLTPRNHDANKPTLEGVSLCIFRRGCMRIGDNHVLRAACRHAQTFCVYILEQDDLSDTMGARMAIFLNESINCVDSMLKERGQRLIVLKGDPAVTVTEFAKAMGVTHVYAPDSSDPHEIATMKKVEDACGCPLQKVWQHTLYQPSEFASLAAFPLIFKGFLETALAMREPHKPIPPPKAGSDGQSFPLSKDAGDALKGIEELHDAESAYVIAPFKDEHEAALKGCEKAGSVEMPLKLETMGSYKDAEGPWNAEKKRCDVPGDVSFKPVEFAKHHPAGEVAGLQRLVGYAGRGAVKDFKRSEDRNKWMMPNDEKLYSSGMSPYIACGCVSIRQVYAVLAQEFNKDDANAVATLKKDKAAFADSILSHLYWREFAIQLSRTVPNFSTYDNPILAKPKWAEANPGNINKIGNAQTGVPLVDAAMTQLRTYGWASNFLRHKVAEFLCRSGLWQNWVEGLNMFVYLQLDYEFGLNQAAWLIQSRTALVPLEAVKALANAAPLEDVEDPAGAAAYVKSLLPALKDVPDEHVLKPWAAPDDVKEKCKDYPAAMTDMSPEAQKKRNTELSESIQENCKDLPRYAYSAKGDAPKDAPDGMEDLENGFKNLFPW